MRDTGVTEIPYTATQQWLSKRKRRIGSRVKGQLPLIVLVLDLGGSFEDESGKEVGFADSPQTQSAAHHHQLEIADAPYLPMIAVPRGASINTRVLIVPVQNDEPSLRRSLLPSLQ